MAHGGALWEYHCLNLQATAWQEYDQKLVAKLQAIAPLLHQLRVAMSFQDPTTTEILATRNAGLPTDTPAQLAAWRFTAQEIDWAYHRWRLALIPKVTGW